MTLDLGVLLSLPVESITIRVILATAICGVLARLVLRLEIRSSTVRVVLAVAPALVLIVVAVAASSQLRLPQLFVPVDGTGVVPIRVAGGYQEFSPMELPLLVGLWLLLAGGRSMRRFFVFRTTGRQAARAVRSGEMPGDVWQLAQRVAADLGVARPRVTVVEECKGGAYVVGQRQPTIVLDRTLVARLDSDELQGVIAHELAHVRRRDNAVAVLVGIVRDLAFFVPGVGWAARQLHRERELAADQVAVGVTKKPGALASGLLKVLESDGRGTPACATLAPKGSLVDRVKILVEDRPTPTRARHGLELGTTAAIASVSVMVAMIVPALLAGAEHQRDAVAVVWSPPADEAGSEPITSAPARAFDVYRRSSAAEDTSETGFAVPHDDDASAFRRSTLHACRNESAACPSTSRTPGLGLRPQPQPVITVDDRLTGLWQATPVVAGRGTAQDEGFRFYWLSQRS